MESTFNRYIWKHTSSQQIWIMCVVMVSMVPYYYAFDLPKMLIDGPIQGGGFEKAGATQAFLPGIFSDLQLDRIGTLIALSMMFLGLVIINGLFKYYVNTYKGLLGERLLRRIRYDLLDRILRFLPVEFRRIKGGEIASMIKDEVEPLGGFTGDAYVQPLLLGGQAITALIFILVQNIWLGLLAFAMASIQMLFIPRLRQRLLVLGRERQIAARQLAGRVTEIVEGIETIHAFDTSNFERADIASRLATLFRVRFQIYTWKYKIKFLNNFLAQITPFLFYLIGGYFAITGSLDLGQLVAVIAAYKELPGPLKALIDWDLAKQDVEVRYEQLLEHFDVDDMLSPSVQAVTKHNRNDPITEMNAVKITVEDHGGSVILENISLTIRGGESVAVIGDANGGANALAEVFGGKRLPAQGKLLVGKENLASLPESVSGRKLSYVSADTYFFYGTVQDNLLYGLKHSPLDAVEYLGADAISRKWELVEAKRTANPVLDLNSNWVNSEQVTGFNVETSLVEAMRRVLRAVNFSDDVFDFALQSKVHSKMDPDFANEIVSLRSSIQEEMKAKGLSELIIPFDVDGFNGQATILENILFGILISPDDTILYDGVNAYLHNMLRETGLDIRLLSIGLQIAEAFNELFIDLPEDHAYFEQFDLIDSSKMPEFRELYQRSLGRDVQSIGEEDRLKWIKLSFEYSEPQYRFGLLDEDFMQKIVAIRKKLHENMPEELRGGIEVYDANNFLSSANMLDNMIFGKVDKTIKNGEQKLREVVVPLLRQQPKIYNDIFSIGLDFNVGPSGRRLSPVQRQKLNLARVLMRRSDFYIFNRPISGLDQEQQGEVIEKTLALFESDNRAPGIIWVLASESNTLYFQKSIKVMGKQICKQKGFLDVD